MKSLDVATTGRDVGDEGDVYVEGKVSGEEVVT